jgi:Predicted solute binding protein
MSRLKGLSLGFLALLALAPAIGLLSPVAQANYATAQASFSFYMVSLSSFSGGFNGPMGGQQANVIHYLVVQSNGTRNVTGTNASVRVTSEVYDYALVSVGTETVSGNVTLSIANNELTIESNVPYLSQVVIETAGQEYIAWAGLTNGTSKAVVPAYVNGTAKVYLYFLNGSGFYVVNADLRAGSTVTVPIKATLQSLSVSSVSVVSSERTFVVNEPRRYAPLPFYLEANGTVYSDEEGYTVGKAYWNGTLVPAIVWRGEGKFKHETISFYGVNGTLVGYVSMFFLNASSGLMAIGPVVFGHKIVKEISMLNIVKLNGKVVEPEFEGETMINGAPVVIIVGHRGEVMSTGNVTLSHEVYLNGTKGAIAWVEVNGTTKAVVVFEDNTTANVTVVKPENVSSANVTYQGTPYNAIKVVVPNVSGVMTFNVTVNGSVVTVLKETSDGKLVALNFSDYFLTNGRLVVVDDPTQTYYVVTGPATATSSSVTTSSNTTSIQTSSLTQITSSSATTSSSSTSSQTSSSTQTSTTSAQMPSSSSSVTSSNNTVIIIVGIIVVLIVVAAIATLLRRK